MAEHLNVLIVDDSEDDARLLVRALRRGGFEPVDERVETAEGVGAAFESKAWDVVLCDMVMPGFSAAAALKIVRRRELDLPFIVVSGIIGMDDAVDLMRAGAHDFVRKDDLARLVPALERELREAEVRRERKRAEEALKESEKRLSGIMNNVEDAIFTTDERGAIESLNPAAELIFGYSADELRGQNVMVLMPEPYHSEHDRYIDDYLRTGRSKLLDFGPRQACLPRQDGTTPPLMGRRKDGTTFPLECTISEVLVNGKHLFIGVVRDITERQRAEEASRRLAAAIEGLSETFVLFDADDRIVVCNEAFRNLHRAIPEVTAPGTRFEDFIRAMVGKGIVTEALGREEECIQQRLERHRKPRGTFETLRNDGRCVLISELRLADGGTATITTDITERKRAEDELRESEARAAKARRQLLDAVESIAASFILYDADERLVLCNGTAREFFPEVADLLVPGARFEDLTRARLERTMPGAAAGRIEERLRERLDGFRRPGPAIEEHHADGRWTQAFERRTADGGTVCIRTDITEIKRQEEELRESEARFRDFTVSASDWFWEMDENLRFSYFSDRFTQVTGVQPEKLLGKTRQETAIPGVDEKAWRRHLADLTAHRPFRDFIHPRTFPNGDVIHLSINGQPVFDGKGDFKGYRGTGTDITALKRAEEKLHTLSSAVEQSPASVIITDTDGAIEYVNQAFMDVTGYTREDVIGHNPRILKSGQTPEATYKRLWATVTAGKVWRGTLHNKRKDGTPYLAGVSISPITTADGTIIHLLGAQQDVTERVETEKRLRRMERMEALGNLAGGIAHDFNNLLIPIMALSQMTMEEFPRESRVRERMGKVVRAADSARYLVSRILLFAREEEPKFEICDIFDVVRQAMELVDSLLPSTIKIKENLDPETGIVSADAAQIETVLLNLASNAADAMMGKPGELELSLSRVEVDDKLAASVAGLKAGAHVLLSVADCGHGMDESTMNHLFDPFFTTKEVGKGTGLGLSTVDGIVARHSGAIDVFSMPGSGSRFDIYLPLQKNRKPAHRAKKNRKRKVARRTQ